MNVSRRADFADSAHGRVPAATPRSWPRRPSPRSDSRCRGILDVCAVDLRSTHTDPRHVGGEVVPFLLALDVPGLSLFGQQMQAFVAGVEVDRVAACTERRSWTRRNPTSRRSSRRSFDRHRGAARAARNSSPNTRGDAGRQTRRRSGRDEIQRQRRALVAAQEQLRSGSRRGREARRFTLSPR